MRLTKSNEEMSKQEEPSSVYYQMCLSDCFGESDHTNPVSDFVSGGRIQIDRSNWEELNAVYTKDQLISYISSLILQEKIGMPMVDLKFDDAVESFKNLCDYKCKGIQTGSVFTRYEYEYYVSDKYFDESNIGNVASNYFQQENRFYCDSINSPSPYRTWHNEKFIKSALSALWSLKVREVGMDTLRSILSLRKYTASQFKPTIAKAIYEYFGSETILDMCSGWGDRLCAFYSSSTGKRYVGIDPNTRLHEAYGKQISLYESMTSGKEATMIKAAAEDLLFSSDCFDTVFTSPPYFNVERYSQEDTQSFKRYKTLETWLEGFLFKAIDMAWRALKVGGHLAINISDVYANHTINKICDPMNRHIESIGGMYMGGWGCVWRKDQTVVL